MGDTTSTAIQQQAAAVEEVSASLQEIAGMSDNLNNLAVKD
jgi:methyl-accepting chemotaxis protein